MKTQQVWAWIVWILKLAALLWFFFSHIYLRLQRHVVSRNVEPGEDNGGLIKQSRSSTDEDRL